MFRIEVIETSLRQSSLPLLNLFALSHVPFVPLSWSRWRDSNSSRPSGPKPDALLIGLRYTESKVIPVVRLVIHDPLFTRELSL